MSRKPDEENEKKIDQTIEALVSLSDWIDANKGVAAKTTIKCPRCGSKLYVMKSGCNDHTMGKCSGSDNCLEWMQ